MSVGNMGDIEKVVHIGSRKSQLALIQSNHVMGLLKKQFPDKKFDIVSMTTTGDNILDVALSKIGDKALFTKELEKALEDKTVDFVVHSLKDLPSTLPKGLVIGAILKRDSPYDCVLIHPKYKDYTLDNLPHNSSVGTSSLRRIAQLKRKYPHLMFKDVRGNLNTRLRKLDEADDFAALILAEAGLDRMGWTDRVHQVLSPEDCMYAVSQGALAVECREDDTETLDLLSSLHDQDTLLRCIAERGLLRKLEGGCSVPVAVHSEVREEERLYLKAGVFSLDGSQAVIDSMEVSISEPPTKKAQKESRMYSSVVAGNVSSQMLAEAERLGTTLAEQLIANGAKPILDAAKLETARAIQEKYKEKQKAKVSAQNGHKAEPQSGDQTVQGKTRNGHEVSVQSKDAAPSVDKVAAMKSKPVSAVLAKTKNGS